MLIENEIKYDHIAKMAEANKAYSYVLNIADSEMLHGRMYYPTENMFSEKRAIP